MPWGVAAAAGASIIGSAISAGGASSAADAQSAANQQALDFQKQVYGNTQAQLAPFVSTGTSSLSALAQLYGLPAPSTTPITSGTATASGTLPSGGTGAVGLPSGWQIVPGGASGNGEIGGSGGPAGTNILDANGNIVQSFAAGVPISSIQALYGGAPATTGTTATAPTTTAAQPNGAAQAFYNFTQTPAYQFPLQQGELAAQRLAASTGTLNSGGTLKALTNYGQGYASQGFGNYVSQLQQLASLGQNSAVMAGSQGNQSASTTADILSRIGTANASGIAGSTNAITGGLSNLLPLLNSGGSSFGGGGGFGSALSGLFGGGGGFGSAAGAGFTGAVYGP